MGGALLQGWLDRGVDAGSVTIRDPHPADWLRETPGLRLNQSLPDAPAVVLVAVKPQMIDAALPPLAGLGGGGTVFVSIAAGASLARFMDVLGAGTPVVRAMPNTPAAIGQGITALVGNAAADEAAITLAETLMAAVGQTVRLTCERQMDAVTALSGSGPAYVFHLIESLAAAGEAEGLAADLAMTLACATVAGAGALAAQASESPAQLRVNVTSPAGTTEAGLRVLMDAEAGLPSLIGRTVAAAAARSRELGK